MAGKSTYMRQTALIVLMAQIGSFVPAKSASIGVVDRVFTRIGASDDLSAGQSTFMVEMTEVAEILRCATKNSLIILDEIGRGHLHLRRVAIARAVLEYCAGRRLGAKTMFATHYHELTALEGSVKGVRNYYITARETGRQAHLPAQDSPRRRGRELRHRGRQARGVPEQVVSRAREYLAELTSATVAAPAAAPAEDGQLSLANAAESEAAEAIRSASLDTMSPIEAMTLLYELKRKLEG